MWSLDKAKDIVDYEVTALVVTCADELKIQEIEAEITILTVAISEALLEAFSLGAASTQEAPETSAEREVASKPHALIGS